VLICLKLPPKSKIQLTKETVVNKSDKISKVPPNPWLNKKRSSIKINKIKELSLKAIQAL